MLFVGIVLGMIIGIPIALCICVALVSIGNKIGGEI